MLSELVEALQIFLKYDDPDYPTRCEHGELLIHDIDIEQVSKEDITRLDELGFIIDNERHCFKSYRYGWA